MLFLYHFGKGIVAVSAIFAFVSFLLKRSIKQPRASCLVKVILWLSVVVLLCTAYLVLFYREVPDVTGLSCDNALQTLRENNLDAILLNYQLGQSIPNVDEKIVEQNPTSGLRSIGTPITLYYGEKVGSIENRSKGHPYDNEGLSYFSPGKRYKKGDSFLLGSYEQNDDDGDGKEWIEWEVLASDADRMLVISKYGLKYVPFQTDNKDHTWENSLVRNWLNGTDSSSFLGSSFTEEENKLILYSEIKNEENPAYFTSSGRTTYDHLFCLSIDEAIKYFDTKDDRVALPTNHAANTCDNQVHRDGDHWWLRTMGNTDREVTCVRGKGDTRDPGTINYYGSHIDGTGIMVRPAMWISISP